MRILLVTLNARYVHTNLAIRYLREVLEEQGQDNWEVQLKEFSINEHSKNIAAEIYEEKPDIIGFSCYLWNISQTTALMRRLRQVLPQAYFLVGGPEVSFDPEELLTQHPQLDAVVVGEGEYSLPALVKTWSEGELPWKVKGLVWRFRKPRESRNLEAIIPPEFQGKYRDEGSNIIFSNEMSTSLPDLNRLPNPYAKEEDFQGKLVYVETSRGCPFSCQFCISSTFRGIRYLEPEKFRLVLRKLFHNGARTIKFVDRTFNARKQHAFRILDVFREEAERLLPEAGSQNDELNKSQVILGVKAQGSRKLALPRAHCEMAGELLDKEWLDYLQDFPQGMIQLEIGVQSTHQPTLEAVQRPQNFLRWKDKISFLQHTCNIPVHLDLIAGLPLEGWQEFRSSFNEVFAVRPTNLQLGFLKVLKGSGIWQRSTDYGLVYSPDPPYTVLRTKELSHGEILALSRIEDVLEKYYNSGRFKNSLECILKYISEEGRSSFNFFYSLAEYWHSNGWFKREWKPRALFENLDMFLCLEFRNNKSQEKNEIGNLKLEIKDIWREVLRFDYYLLERPGLVPAFLQPTFNNSQNKSVTTKEIEKKKEEIRSNPCWQEIIPEARDLDRRQWARATAVDYFAINIEQAGSLLTREDNKADTESGARSGVEGGAWYLFYYGEKGNRYYKYNY